MLISAVPSSYCNPSNQKCQETLCCMRGYVGWGHRRPPFHYHTIFLFYQTLVRFYTFNVKSTILDFVIINSYAEIIYFLTLYTREEGRSGSTSRSPFGSWQSFKNFSEATGFLFQGAPYLEFPSLAVDLGLCLDFFHSLVCIF